MNGFVFGFILGWYKWSLGLCGVLFFRGDIYCFIGGNYWDNGMMYYDVLIKKVFKGEDKVWKIRGIFIDVVNLFCVFVKIYFFCYYG